MDRAIAIAFGGEEVLATESSESDFYDLGLLCPVCREAVMYVKGYEKHIRGQAVQIEPCFRHFKETDSVSSEKCELRIKHLSKDDWDQINSDSKWQRQRIFQKYLWIIFCENSPTFTTFGKKRIKKFLDKKYLFLEGKNEYFKDKQLKDLYMDNFLRMLREEKHIWMGGLHKTVEQYFLIPLEEILNEEIRDIHSKFRETIGNKKKSRAYQRLHESTCIEVIDFMSTDSGQYFFKDIFTALFILVNSYIRTGQFLNEIPKDTPHYTKVLIGILQALNMQIAGIHWGNEIGKRHYLKKASQKVAASLENS